MKNRVKELRETKDWSQAQLAEAMNNVLIKRPDLKKITKRNPDGLMDQQTAQRLESGEIELSDRYLIILSEIFGVTPNDIMGITSDDEFQLLQLYRSASDDKRQSFLNLFS